MTIRNFSLITFIFSLASAEAAAAVLTAGNAEIVIPKDATPVVQFAAKEAKDILSQTFGSEVPVVTAPSAGKCSLVLGMNEWAAAVGLTTNDLARDEFRTVAKGGRVYILGKDDGKVDPEKVLAYGDWGPIIFERATTFGLYDFLERYAGVRFYFPGELGTIVPRKDAVEVPDGERRVVPPYSSRLVQMWHGEYFEKVAKDRVPKTLDFFRLRFETWRKPCCHGSTGLMLPERFGKEHPEYFALLPGGARSNVKDGSHGAGRLCWTSGIVDEIYKDAASYFRGEGPEKRGMLSRDGKHIAWNGNCSDRKWVDVMPDDCFDDGCLCAKCRALSRDEFEHASDILWSAVSNVAARVKADGLDGRIVNMAYPPYRRVPDFALPDNVDVMVATTGPWSQNYPDAIDHDNAIIRAWAEKLGHKVWLWNYANKWGIIGAKTPGVPTVAPRAWAKYYKSLAPWIEGAFCESETDRWLFNYLNYYVYSRVCWDLDTDVEAVLAEHHRLMFGAAAPEMTAFFDKLEDLWMNGVLGRGKVVMTPMGPSVHPPSDKVMWTEIFSTAAIDGLYGLCAKAQAKVPADSLEARRVALFRREYLDPLKATAADYHRKQALTATCRHTLDVGGCASFSLVPFAPKGRTPADNVRTDVTVKRTADKLVVTCVCEEPHMDALTENCRERDDKDLWLDNCLELFVFSANDQVYYQFYLTSAGVAGEAESTHSGAAVRGLKWSPEGVVTHVEKRADGWTGTFEIPLAAFPDLREEFPFNVARERNLTGAVKEPYHRYYQWAPCAFGFSDAENLGRLRLVRPDETAAIQSRIDACAAKGGGRVTVGKGVHWCYTLNLRSNVELHLEEGAVLKGGEDGLKYPVFPASRFWRPERSVRGNRRAFIYADGATNVAVTGKGVIDGSAPFFHAYDTNAKRWVRTSDTNLTGRCMLLAACRDVRVEGVTFRNPTGWATWFLDCDNLLVRDVAVRADPRFMNGDGLHLGGCRDVLITGCDVDSEDDALVLRAQQEVMLVPHALERVVVSNCVLRANRPNGIRIGWSGDAPVRDVLVTDCVIPHSGVGIGCWLPPINVARGNDPVRRLGATPVQRPADALPFAVKNVRFRNLDVTADRNPVVFDVFDLRTWDEPDVKVEQTPVTAFEDVVFENCRFHCPNPPRFSLPDFVKTSNFCVGL